MMGDHMTPPINKLEPHYAVLGAPPPVDTSHIKRKYLDVSYAKISKAQKLDIYLPDDAKQPYPVIVAIHGGAFMGCDKGDLQVTPMLEGLKHGFAVVSINYRMSGEAKFPALVQDAKAAVRWIRGNAQKYGFNPQKIVAWGGSAGAYLASMLAISENAKELEDLSLGYPDQSCGIQAAILWYAPANFSKMDEQLAKSGLASPAEMSHNNPNSPESLLLGETITKIPERVKAANPETYIGKKIPPMLIQHGRKDPVVPFQQSVELVEKLKLAFGENAVTLEIFDNAEHADPAFETLENVTRIFNFFKQNNIY
jgi:acetyl esterase/lipase